MFYLSIIDLAHLLNHILLSGRIGNSKDVNPITTGSPGSPIDEGVTDMSTTSLMSSIQSASSFE